MIINITPSTLSSASHIDRSSNDASTTNRRERDTTIPVLGLCGSLYEWFDFASFASMSPEIGAAFFPKENAQKQLLYTLLIFSMSFILHPLGALIFGEIADNGHLNSSMAQVRHCLVTQLLASPCISNKSTPNFTLVAGPQPGQALGEGGEPNQPEPEPHSRTAALLRLRSAPYPGPRVPP